MADKLGVYNEALSMMREPNLVTLEENDDSENSRVIRKLNAVYRPAVKACLEAGNWNHAEKMAWLQLVDETPVEVWSYYYAKPSGWLRTCFISETGILDDPLHDYRDIDGKIAANASRVFMRYVSDHVIDLQGRWPQHFADYVSAEMAVRAAPDLVSASAEFMREIKSERKRAMGNSLALDAMNNPPDRLGRGRWARAGRGGRGGILTGRGV